MMRASNRTASVCVLILNYVFMMCKDGYNTVVTASNISDDCLLVL